MKIETEIYKLLDIGSEDFEDIKRYNAKYDDELSEIFGKYRNSVLPTLDERQRTAVEALLELQFFTCVDFSWLGFARGLNVGIGINKLRERNSIELLEEWKQELKGFTEISKIYTDEIDAYLEECASKVISTLNEEAIII